MDTYGSVYKEYFNPSNPMENRLVDDDESGQQHQFIFTIALETNITYILIVTTSSSNPTGAFSIFVSGPDNVDLKTISSPSIIQVQYSLAIQSNYSSELTTNSQTYSRDCRKSNYYYQAIRMHVVETGYYALISNSNMNTFGNIYEHDFNPMNPFDNLLPQDYRSLVTTSSPNITGKFSILTSGPNVITLNAYNISSASTSNFTTLCGM
ncbi:unnamed protein product [Adineta steineri]|uniref:Uncharacterized protein n=1 Tax=Adineta steineri TaxID=433720 RepID=A0A819UNE3_9BILA|nr:unnamed protein product [Adineta steineri]